MATPKKQPDDTFADLFFPERGFNDSVSLSDMPPGFTPVGENVRAFEPLTGRGRGGSRPGLDQFIPEKVSGTHEIQHITTIVSVDGALVGWSGPTGDPGFPGTYGGIGFIDPIPGGGFGGAGSPDGFDPFPDTGLYGTGGGGYQPNDTHTRIIKVGYRLVVDGVTEDIAMSTTATVQLQAPAGHPADVVVYARITNQDGRDAEFLAFESLTLYTYPNGEVGDTIKETSQFDLQNPPVGVDGLAEIEVYSDSPKTVVYRGANYAVLGSVFRSRRPFVIRWTPFKLRQVASASTAPIG